VIRMNNQPSNRDRSLCVCVITSRHHLVQDLPVVELVIVAGGVFVAVLVCEAAFRVPANQPPYAV
jgi:hypothetical protein